MKASLILITTNHPNPNFSLLKRAMKTVSRLKTDFVDEYILSVDMFKDGESRVFMEGLAGAKWKVVFGESTGKRSMADNQIRGLCAAENDWVLCCEDDSIITKIPTAFHVELAESLGVMFVLYNANVKDGIEYINDSGNYITTEEDAILVKGSKRGNYVISFPGIITKKNYLLDMHGFTKAHPLKKKIEASLTRAWKSLYLDKKIGIYLNRIDFAKTVTQDRLHHEAHLIYWNNTESLRHPSLLGGETVWT